MDKLEIDNYVDKNNFHKVKLFLENKGNVNQRVQRYSGSTLLYSAVVSHNTNIDMINLLLENKANVNLGQYNNQTPLHAAISHNNLDIIKTLIKNKANILINAKDNSNSIIYSISEKRLNILEYLLSIQLKKNNKLLLDKFKISYNRGKLINKYFSLIEWCKFKKHDKCLAIILNFKDFMKNGKKYKRMKKSLINILDINLINIVQEYIIGFI